LGSAVDLMQPRLLGFYRREKARKPDVLVRNKQGAPPQFRDADLVALVVDDKAGSLTEDIVRNADEYVVIGCRTMKGDFRGVSVFDKKNLRLPFDWFKIPKGTVLPAAVACTRDSALESSTEAIHYTIAPKDDMTLALFLQCLKEIAAKAVKE
jgi:hypothetical protein